MPWGMRISKKNKTKKNWLVWHKTILLPHLCSFTVLGNSKPNTYIDTIKNEGQLAAFCTIRSHINSQTQSTYGLSANKLQLWLYHMGFNITTVTGFLSEGWMEHCASAESQDKPCYVFYYCMWFKKDTIYFNYELHFLPCFLDPRTKPLVCPFQAFEKDFVQWRSRQWQAVWSRRWNLQCI